MDKLVDVLGKSFKSTAIEDPVLEPYFILKDQGGGFSVNKKRIDKNGKLKFSALSYPGSFMRCLEYIAKERLHEEGKIYGTVQDYIAEWKSVCNKIAEVYKDWNIKEI